MIASKVTIAPSLVNHIPLKYGEKQKLRERLAIEFIQSKPYMKPLHNRDFVEPLQMSVNNVSRFLKVMERKGLIDRHELIPWNNAYTVANPVKIKPISATKKPKATRRNFMSHGRLEKQVLVYFLNNPSSQTISLNQIVASIGMGTHSGVHNAINNLIKKGRLIRTTKGRSFVYGVPTSNKPVVDVIADVQTQIQTAPPPLPALPPEPPVKEPMVCYTEIKDVIGATLDFAKEYYWETTSNDLHGFVTWLKEHKNG